MALLKEQQRGARKNSEEMIELAYDLQTGSYIAAMKNGPFAKNKVCYSAEIAKVISSLTRPRSILEAGVGEATTLSGVVHCLRKSISVRVYGFDVSWSRVAYARKWLIANNINDAQLCVGSLFHIPYADNSVDIVYTSHSIEPNGGNERPILKELYRIARRYIILLEPAYELAAREAKERMKAHGYCRHLLATCRDLGFEVLEHKLFPFVANPLNPTALTIIKKNGSSRLSRHVLACPKLKTPLVEIGGLMFSQDALAVYPVVAGIPCLRLENAIVASKFPEIIGNGFQPKRGRV